jgi:hypothetical protein
MLSDENDRLLLGTLPVDPEEGSTPMASDESEAWEEPVAFDDVEVPPFPVDVLPPPLAKWAREQAVAIQVPPDLPALLGLSALSLATAKKVVVEIKPGWREPTNIYTATALLPGEGKSPVFAGATAPLREWERERRARLAPQIADAEECSRLREERTRELRKKAAKAQPGSERQLLEDELRALAVEHAGAQEGPPVPIRLVADDATPEAVGRLLADQHGRLGVFSSEGGPFAIMAGRYSDGRANCELFCKAHSGDAYDLDRIGRPSIHLAVPLLTIGLTVQPSVIAGLASTPAFRSLGLLARFLYAIPRTVVGSRDPDPPAVSDAARLQYARTIRAWLELEEERDEHGEMVPRPLPLADDARALLIRFKGALEPRLGPTGDLHGIADWGNKLPGLVARIAGILHAGDHGGPDAIDWPIPGETLARAARVGIYAIAHARAAFGLMGADAATALARRVWAWARCTGQPSVTKRQIHRAMQSHVTRAAELDPALGILVERCLFREVQVVAPGRPGRHPSPAFEINPRTRQ